MIGMFLPPWWKLAAAGMLAVALAGGVWKIRHAGVVAGRAEIQAKWDTEKTALVELARRIEANKIEANRKVDNDYQQIKARAAADKRISDSRLRDFQAAAASSGTDAATASGGDDPYPRIASECAAALVVLDGYAKDLAGKAGALQGYAREVCLKN